ncbi:hypothetical protein RJT34_04851 [Clitoria ternatea]|uniref:Uncharacterized protein n=1 Tax=Clitoria ternatea TaxID=43366 RepID=A0AAN9Q314_CLITE
MYSTPLSLGFKFGAVKKGDWFEEGVLFLSCVSSSLLQRASWSSFLGYKLKPAPSVTKSSAGNSATLHDGMNLNVSQTDSGNTVKDPMIRTKAADGKSESIIAATKSDSGHGKHKMNTGQELLSLAFNISVMLCY